MYKIEVYKERTHCANISQLSVKREWMDGSWGKHAYHCFPVTLTNRLGWGLSFPEDIRFIWDGTNGTSSHHVTILEGEKFAHTGRGNGTISFITGLTFRTDENLSLLQLPVPNQFNPNYQAFTTLISSSFYHGEMPVSFKILKPLEEIVIPAGEPIISIVPISLTEIQDSTVTLHDGPSNFYENEEERIQIMIEGSIQGKWAHFYRDGVDHLGNVIGKHEVKGINLHVNDLTSGSNEPYKNQGIKYR